MITPTIIISTCDSTNHILEVSIYLLEKYWNFTKNVIIVGYNKPVCTLPVNYTFLSAGKTQVNINNWGIDLFNVLKLLKDKFVIFMLDDMLQTDYFNFNTFDLLNSLITNNKNIVRCCLGFDLQSMPCTEIINLKEFSVVEKNKNINYRFSTQPSIWNLYYLLNLLKVTTTPWDFETKHNSLFLDKKIIGTRKKYSSTTLIETALSNNHPNKINILGVKPEDVSYLISEKMLNPDVLQFGIKPGLVPSYKEYGTSFSLDVLHSLKYQSPQIKENLYDYYLERYGKIYC